MVSEVTKKNVGRITERIVVNELEFRSFRVFSLNKEGLSANADLLASFLAGRSLQIQVKGATNERLWIQYGHGTEDTHSGDRPVFNRHHEFYSADLVSLVGVVLVQVSLFPLATTVDIATQKHQ